MRILFVFFLKNYPPIFCPFLRDPPLPKNNPTSRISRWKSDLELLSYFIFVRKVCVFDACLLNGHFFWLKISLFWRLCLFFCVPKKPKNTSLARSPALAYAVRISQDGTRTKFEELMLVRFSNRKVYEKTKHKGHARDASGRENGLWSGGKHDVRITMIAWLFLSEKGLRVV